MAHKYLFGLQNLFFASGIPAPQAACHANRGAAGEKNRAPG